MKNTTVTLACLVEMTTKRDRANDESRWFYCLPVLSRLYYKRADLSDVVWSSDRCPWEQRE